MMIKLIAPFLLGLLLAGCTASEPPAPMKAQNAKVDAAQVLSMENICKEKAAQRYNTASQEIAVMNSERFQGSYELRGSTAHNEGFICSFDADGRFLHLSMR